MTQNVFLNKAAPPTAARIAKALKTTAAYWDELKRHVDVPVVEEWKYYGTSHGWTLKLLLKKRNLCFLTVCDGFFIAAFVLGDKGVALAEQSKLPAKLVSELVSAKRYAEGRGIRLEVRSRRVLDQAKMLLDTKLASWTVS